MRHLAPASAMIAITSLVAVACSSSTQAPPGELMLAIDSDITVPKDLDQVQVEVSVRGEVVLSTNYDVGPSATKLPATLGILVGHDPSTPVTIRVVGRLKGAARVVNKAVTSIPSDRIALLRLPLQFLCIGKVVDTTIPGDPTPRVDSSCPADQTCRNGDCVPAQTDPASLPTYTAPTVYGGGAGAGDGTCFDVLGCFASQAPLNVDLGSCSAPKPAGTVNVALVLPSGAEGSCQSSGDCYVPLSTGGTTGWRDDGGTIRLPAEVCTRLSAGKIKGVITSTSCTPKPEAVPTCGPASSVAASCTGTCTTLATGQAYPSSLAVSGASAYVANDDATGSVIELPLAGGPPSVLAPNEPFANGIALDDTGLFWSRAPGVIMNIPPGTKTPVTIFDESYGCVGSFALTPTDVFMASVTNDGLKKIKKDKSDAYWFVTDQKGMRRALASGSNVYWTAGDTVKVTPSDTAAEQTLASGQAWPYGLAVDATSVYWTNRDDGTVMKVPVGGGTPVAIAKGANRPYALAVDATSVYFTEYSEAGSIMKAPIGGGPSVVVAEKQPFASTIAVDATSVYWAIPGQGRVMKASK